MLPQTNTSGIQALLEAEKEAAKIVQKARQYRVDRLKDARKEAEKEIATVKQQKLAEYAKFEKEFAGSSDASTNLVNEETEAKLVQTKNDFEKHQQVVLTKLIDTILKVEPKLHPNVRV